MKSLLTTLSLALALATLTSCNDEKKESTETLTVTDTMQVADNNVSADTQRVVSANGVLVANDQIPGNVSTAFSTKYPAVKKYEWYAYTPAADDDFEMDQSYYYVRFNDDGADYTTWFNNQGEWVKTSTKVPGNKNLPDPVNRYLNVNYPGYAIEEISKENDKDMDMYEIKLNKGESKVKLKVLPDGRLFKRKAN